MRYAPNRYILFLSDEPLATRFASRDQLQTTAAISYRQQLESRQQSVIQNLTGRKIQVVGSVSTVMNAIFVVATADRVAELRALPNVIGVMPERSIRPSLNKATALANAPAAWAQAAIGGQSNAGNGVRIAILDTGIDAGSVHTSPAFVDAGFTAPSGFPKCNAVVNGTPSDCGLYTNNKVIVARSYVSMIAAGNCGAANLTGACTSAGTASASTSMPDDYSARDRDGHGSAVAAVAAAVQNSGGTVPFSGMAPKAFLGSYKIYGSDLVSYGAPESVIIKALDDAIGDGMNVVNFSSGGTAVAGAKDDTQCGNPAGVWCDPMAHAFEVAAQNGTVIVTATGNFGADPAGDLYDTTITSPATAPSVIAVGATVNSHLFNPTVSVNGSGVSANLKNIAADASDSNPAPSIFGADSGVLVDITQAPINDNGQACSALPAGSLTDSYALIRRSPSGSGCTFDVKAINATAAGAIGIVFYNVGSLALASPEVCSTGVCDLNGPGVMISLADGQNIKAYIDAHPGATVTIDSAGAEEALPNTAIVNNLASYSSRGPAIDGSIKPDLVATGGFDSDQYASYGMYTVGQSYDPNGELYSSNGFAAANGTSFAAPLVAGAAALVLQANPTWTALQVKSALVNYAAQTVTADDLGDTVDVQEIGGGLLDANAAVTAVVTAVPSTLSFGYLSSGAAVQKSIPVTVTNNGKAAVTLAVAVSVGVTSTGATVKTDQTSLTLAPGAKTTLNVSLTGTAPAGGEYNGLVTLTSASPAVALRMPYMFLVGDGSFPVANPLYDLSDYQDYVETFSYGAVNQDVGPLPIQVIDFWGVPVAGSTVTYMVTPTGAVSLKPVTSTAGSTGNVESFQPSNCTPSTSTASVSCTTNSYGIAWVEMVDGPTAVTDYSAMVNISAAGTTITHYPYITPQPAITSVQDDGAFGTTLAPGSYVAFFGSNLADPNVLVNPTGGDDVDTTYTSGRLPLTWDLTTVSFDAPASGSLPAISVPGYLEYVSTGQINVFVPWELENYPSAQVKMTTFNTVPSSSNVLTVPLNNYAPAFFMYNSGSVFIADARDNNTGAVITPSNPATAGEVLQLYCDGLGPVTNQPASGNIAPTGTTLAQLANTMAPVTISIGGQNAQVAFAGLTPLFVGLYQVNIVVPSGLTSGNHSITVSVGGKTSPLSITGGGVTYQIVLPIK